MAPPTQGSCGFFMPRGGVYCGRIANHAGSHMSPAAWANAYAATREWKKNNRGRCNEISCRGAQTVHGKAVKLLYDARRRASRKEIPFDLTLEWVESELKFALDNGCPYLGIPIRINTSGAFDPHSPSIDQFNPGAGYTQDNCIIVSTKANTMKNDAPPEFVKKLGDNIDRLGRTRFKREVA